MHTIRSVSPTFPTTIHFPTTHSRESSHASPSRSVPSTPRVTVHVNPSEEYSRPNRGVMTISSLYSTAQCVLSMVGSIGVILLFAGIPQLIYSPSVQLSNLMTFLLGSSLITAMVAGNAFVNYKYRQYIHRNPITRPLRRPSLEGREDKPPPYEDIEKMDAHPPDYPSAVADCTSGSESPPSYHWLARMYQWGNLIDTTASSSHCNQPSTSCDSATAQTVTTNRPPTASANAVGEPASQKNSTVLGHSFHDNASHPCEVHSPRKVSSVSNPSTPSKFAPVIEKFRRGKSITPNVEDSFHEDCKKSGLWTIRKAFLRSVSDDGFLSLPNDVNRSAEHSTRADNPLHFSIAYETGRLASQEHEPNPSVVADEHLASNSHSLTRSNTITRMTNCDYAVVNTEQNGRESPKIFTSIDVETIEPSSTLNFSSLSPSALLTTHGPLSFQGSECNSPTHAHVQHTTSNTKEYKRRNSEACPTSVRGAGGSSLGRSVSSVAVQSSSLCDTSAVSEESGRPHGSADTCN